MFQEKNNSPQTADFKLPKFPIAFRRSGSLWFDICVAGSDPNARFMRTPL